MKLTISKSKNAESFYIQKSFKNNQGESSTQTIRKLGTLKELTESLGTDRDGVIAWAKEQVRIETEKYKNEKEADTVLIPFKASKQMDYNQKSFFLHHTFLSRHKMMKHKKAERLLKEYKLDYFKNIE